MQILTGILFVAAMMLAVILGGQTLDYSWGPGLVFLVFAVLCSFPGLRQLRERGLATWLAVLLIAGAGGWVLYGCFHSPVKEFARSDAMLVGALLLSFVFGLLLQPSGKVARVVIGGLALLGIANLVMVFLQVRDPSVSWPYSGRPEKFPSGFFGHYNHLADFAAAVSGILAARFLFAKDRLAEKVLQAVGALALFICVALSNSRGGLLGLAVGIEVLAIGAFLIALRERSRRLPLMALIPVGLPVLALVPALFLFGKFQENRGLDNPAAVDFADNRTRLVFLGLALRITEQHPLTGGGSRSFGWQKYATWDTRIDGPRPMDDNFAHNEALQAAVDYGWAGAGLVIGAILTTGLCGLAGLVMKDEEARSPRFRSDAMVVGGLAAMAATLVNSNFSFVTHTLPGVIYLGLALGLVLPRRTPLPSAYGRRMYAAAPVALGTLAVAIPLLWASLRACGVYRLVWPVVSSQLALVDPNDAADRMKEASERWPSAALLGAGGQICQAAASRPLTDPADMVTYLNRAEKFYAEASAAYPYSVEWPLNRAQVLVSLHRNEEAEQAYQTALSRQGGMEGLFRVKFLYSWYLIERWDSLWKKSRRAEEALTHFLQARQMLAEARRQTDLFIHGRQIDELITQLNEKIAFLEGAGIRPAP